MKDIRSDLKERVEDIDSQIKGLEGQMVALRAHRESILDLLRKEEQLFLGTNQPSIFSSGNGDAGSMSPTKRTHALPEVIIDILAEGHPLTLDEIAASADKVYPFGGKSAKRSINTTLLGMKSGKKVERLPDGRWKMSDF